MSCDEYRELIELKLGGELTEDELPKVQDHLDDCNDCREYDRALRDDDRRLIEMAGSMESRITSLEDRIVGELLTGKEQVVAKEIGASWWRNLAAWKPARYATAAILLLGTVLVLSLLRDAPGLVPVAWAEVITNVENADDFICRWRMESNILRDGDIEGVRYKSKRYGTRDDQYQNDRLMIRTYWIPETRESIALHVYDEAYMITRHHQDEFIERSMQRDAQEMVKYFKSHHYRELGTRTIDGVRAAGIELEDPEFLAGAFDSGTIRLWVDTATNWPVRLETSLSADNDRLDLEIEFYDFHWNTVIDRTEVEPEIPDGYQLALELDAPVADEARAIEALRGHSEITRGHYPTTMTWGSSSNQAVRDIRKYGVGGRDRVRLVEKFMKIRDAIAFHVELRKAGREVRYYGDKITARDFDRVLMRYRLDDGDYRVIYGDLRAETVTADRLEELE